MHMLFARCAAASLLLLTATGFALPASAAEKLRVGKAVPEAFSFVPLDIGMRKGLFARNGLEIESIAFAGDARMQQAMASDSLDIALGSGPAMAFIVKGSPIKAVAAEMLVGIDTPTQSKLVVEKFGTGSVAEAAALAAAGPRARLIATRVVSQDRTATAAIAEGDGA